jgi:hypothetical protein
MPGPGWGALPRSSRGVGSRTSGHRSGGRRRWLSSSWAVPPKTPGNQNSYQLFRAAAAKHANIHYLDYHYAYAADHALFFDLSHLNELGKQTVTGRLIDDMRKVLGLSSF